ncbi:MAG: phosphopantetheine-binding protein [Blastopirellula sp.]|nr:MAG: phosphopantetheine-binding protein [Blastopirellula sp.]
MTDVQPSNSDSAESSSPKSAEDIQQWIVNFVSEEISVSPDSVDISAPFENFSIDSAAAIGMTGDLEQWLDKRIDPTAVYDYPTIEEFAEYLAAQK